MAQDPPWMHLGDQVRRMRGLPQRRRHRRRRRPPFPVRVGEVARKDGWPALVNALRHASVGLQEAARQTGNQDIYFPPRGKGEGQPVALRGYVSLREIAGLVHYIADMLEP